MVSPLFFRLGWLLALGLPLAAQAQPATPPARPAKHGFADPVGNGAYLSLGYQAGYWAGGMNNIAAFALDLNRAAASVNQRLVWNDLYHGFYFRAGYFDDNFCGGIGWSNRHSTAETRYVDAAGVAYRTEYRVRLNEVSLEFGSPLWHARLRPGVSADLGLFRVSSRTSKESEDAGEWHSAHSQGSGFLDPGGVQPTAGLTLFCDVAPFGRAGGGLTFRPYYQWHIIQPDLFGRFGTFDSNSYQYRANNYGLALSWTFSSLRP